MKSLKYIQTISKVFWVICKVMFIVCIVGASICLVSLIVLPLTKDVVIYENKSITVLLAEQGTTVSSAISSAACGLFACGVGIALAKYTELFFKKELDLGSPFDKALVKDMRIVAVVHIVTAVVLMGIIALTQLILRHTVDELIDVETNYNASIWFGISLLVISLFCEYGAEQNKEKVKEVENKKEE